MKEEENTTAYFLRVDEIVNIIRGLGERIQESVIFQKILRSLPIKWTTYLYNSRKGKGKPLQIKICIDLNKKILSVHQLDGTFSGLKHFMCTDSFCYNMVLLYLYSAPVCCLCEDTPVCFCYKRHRIIVFTKWIFF